MTNCKGLNSAENHVFATFMNLAKNQRRCSKFDLDHLKTYLIDRSAD